MFGRSNNTANNSRLSSGSKGRYSRDAKVNHHQHSLAGIGNSNNSSANSNGNTGGMCCVRTSVVIFNLITLLAGVATLGIGVWLLQQSHNGAESGEEFLQDVAQQNTIPNQGEFKGFSIILIALGSLVTFVSFIGCFGACIKSRCLLLSYLTTVVLILSLQLLVAVFAIIYRQEVSSSIRDELMVTVKRDYRPTNRFATSWDLVHQQFECCGVDGITDWFEAEAWPKNKFVPDSCCINPNNTQGGNCGHSPDPSIWYSQGCWGQIKMFILEQLHILATVVITLVFLQLYGIISSTLLFYNFKTPKPKNPKAFTSYPYERARM